jgi:hypothetical protein
MSNRIPSNSPDLNAEGYGPFASLDLVFGRQVVSAAGPTAITIKEGFVFVTRAGVAAMTLAAPTAGAQSAAGDDGRTLVIVDTTGYAHTVGCGAAGINGNKATITFDVGSSLPTAAPGARVELVAFNGKWWIDPNALAVSLT